MTTVPPPGQTQPKCHVLELPRVDESRGSLCVAEVGAQVPFEIARTYWIFDVPRSGERAHHAHREQSEVLIAVSGAFTVHSDNGRVRTQHRLDRPDVGLLIEPMVFHHLEDFRPGTVCLVLASGLYDPDEYVLSYEEFRDVCGAA